ncbi:hypothetical protein DER46DRAFT_605912 [Fusarium sp. MPI-SDFR-AT-0072]|nr:hypothetical protein DER46DRAFT_605912 [Fusarium sp. MPI-SDFR-AT-0072]
MQRPTAIDAPVDWPKWCTMLCCSEPTVNLTSFTALPPTSLISKMTNRQRNSNVRLFACLLDDDDIMQSDYRFLADGSLVEYVITAPGTFLCHHEDRAFEPILLRNLLPQFPPGDWNNGHVARDLATGEPSFVKTEMVQFPGVRGPRSQESLRDAKRL